MTKFTPMGSHSWRTQLHRRRYIFSNFLQHFDSSGKSLVFTHSCKSASV